MSELSFIKADVALEETWDREWCRYFSRYHGKLWFDRCAAITDQGAKMIEDLRTASAQCVLEYRPFFDAGPLGIYVNGQDIVGKRIAELGSGPAQLGKQLGHVVEEYLGIDYSPLALRIAGLLSPPSCKFVRMADLSSLEVYKGSRDTVLSRHFFIHQHWENAIWLLKLGKFLLRKDGKLIADFFLNSKNERCQPGRTNVFNPESASEAFEYNAQDIEEMASITGFKIVDNVQHEETARIYVTMEPKSKA